MSYLKIQYDENRVKATTYPAKLVSMLHHLLRASFLGDTGKITVADFGCGRGDFSKAWAKYSEQTYFLDREPPSALKPDQHPIKVDFMRNFVLKPKVNVVFSKSVIEHLEDPKAYLTAIHDSLTEDGVLVLMCPDWRTYWVNFWDDYTHRRAYDQVSLRDCLVAHGFKVESCERMYQLPATWYSPARKLFADFVRLVTPLPLAVWLAEKYGFTWLKWQCQMTLLLIARKEV